MSTSCRVGGLDSGDEEIIRAIKKKLITKLFCNFYRNSERTNAGNPRNNRCSINSLEPFLSNCALKNDCACVASRPTAATLPIVSRADARPPPLDAVNPLYLRWYVKSAWPGPDKID